MSKQIIFKKILFVSLIIGCSTSPMAADIDNEVTKIASNQIEQPSLVKGKQLWQQQFIGKKPYAERSCTYCHGANVTLMGKHIKTHKQIKPMALSSNPQRFTKKTKVDKWFLRNCKWTMGRECTQQEKNDITAYLNSQ
ncbi:MAG: DUF1924 domain-containing protein [Colwellia sp.]|jgi:Domain of unknown function (DUF1924).